MDLLLTSSRAKSATLPTKGSLVLALLTPLALTGCSPAANPSSGSRMSTTASATQTAQSLPLAASFTADGKTVQLRVARSAAEQTQGLMYVATLPTDQGMLFPVSPARNASFWMKNTLIPLDLLFINDGVIVRVTANTPPCEHMPCPSYQAGQRVDQVVELAGGQAEQLGLRAGTALTIRYS